MVGSKQRVLMMRSQGHQPASADWNNRVVNFDGPQTLISDFADVQITQPQLLRGRILA